MQAMSQYQVAHPCSRNLDTTSSHLSCSRYHRLFHHREIQEKSGNVLRSGMFHLLNYDFDCSWCVSQWWQYVQAAHCYSVGPFHFLRIVYFKRPLVLPD